MVCIKIQKGKYDVNDRMQAKMYYIQFNYYVGSGLFPNPKIQVIEWQ